MSTHNIPFFNMKKKKHQKLSQICSYGMFSKGLKNEFESHGKRAISVRAIEVLLYKVYFIQSVRTWTVWLGTKTFSNAARVYLLRRWL